MTSAAAAQQKITKLFTNVDRLDQVVNGDSTTTVHTDGGDVPSLAKLAAEVLAGTSVTLVDDFGDGSSVTRAPTVRVTFAALATKAPLASPAFTGTPTIGGVAIATQTYTDNKVAGLVNSAPSTLDTLNELAAALANDPSFATTMTNALAAKAALAGAFFTGSVNIQTPNAGTTGALRIVENATSGLSYIQFIDSTFSTQRGYLSVTAAGVFNFTGPLSIGNDANFTLNVNGGTQPFLGFDNGDNSSFVRSSNTFVWNIDNTPVLTVNTTNITYSGHVVWHDGNLDIAAIAGPAGAYATAGLTAPAFTSGPLGIRAANQASSQSATAISDIISRYYDATNTRIYSPDGGVAFNPSQRPFLWEMFLAHNIMFWDWKNAPNSTKLGRLTSNYTAHRTLIGGDTQLQAAAIASDIGAVDDAAWNALWMIQVYQAAGTSQALVNAATLIGNTRTKFADPNNSGSPYGLWYQITQSGTSIDGAAISTTAAKKSTTYEAVLAIAGMYAYQANTSTYSAMLTYAQNTWSWMHSHLKASSGVYWREFNLDPSSGEYLQPHTNGETALQPGRSFSYHHIMGTCAMAVLSALLYNATGNSAYLTEAQSIIASMVSTSTFLRPGNIFLSDADGWENGTMFPYVVQEVLPLTGVDPTGAFRQALVNTGAAIARKRTDRFYTANGINYGAGLYPADWTGPESGIDSSFVWTDNGVYPYQIMTSGTSAAVVVAAAMASTTLAVQDEYVRRSWFDDILVKTFTSYANLNTSYAQVFKGPVQVLNDFTANYVKADGGFYMHVSSGHAIINFDTNVSIDVNRGGNAFSFGSAGAQRFLINTGGFSTPFAGTVGTTLGVGSTLTVAAGGAVINGGLSVLAGTTTVAGTFTVSSGGAQISGGAVVNGGMSVPSGTTTLANNLTINSGGAVINGGLSVPSGTATFAGTLSVTSGGAQVTGGITSGGLIQPGSDNTYVLGAAGARWSTVYAATGSINTSDQRDKTWRGALNAAELAAAKEIAATIGIFQFNDSVAEKGQDGARLHTGVIAQQAGAILEAHGLTKARYAWFCYDEWEEIPAVPEVAAVPAVPDEHDADGNLVKLGTPEIPAVPGIAARPAGNRYGIRYDELAMFIVAAQEQRLAALEA